MIIFKDLYGDVNILWYSPVI